jgi:hypothetical protein
MLLRAKSSCDDNEEAVDFFLEKVKCPSPQKNGGI